MASITDSIGRALELKANVLGSAFANALLQKLPKPVMVQNVKEDQEVIEEIRDLLKKIESKLGKEVEESVEVQEKVLKEIKQIRKDNEQSQKQQITAASKNPLVVQSKPKGTAVVPYSGRVSASKSGGTIFPGNIKGQDIVKQLGLSSLGPILGSAIFSGMSSAVNSFVRSTGIKFEEMFSGAFADEFEYSKFIKKQVAETREFGETFDDVSKKFHDFGKVVDETGASRSAFQNAYLKNLKKGLQLETVNGKLVKTNAKDQQQVLKNAMSTAFAIGTEAHSTAEMFTLWQRRLRLTKTELFQVGFSMREIGRQTSVTSDALLEAAQASQVLFERMKKTGSLRFSSMENVMKLVATGSKYGVDQTNLEMAEGISSFTGFLDMQNQELKGFIARSVAGNNELFNAMKAGVGLDEKIFPQIGRSMLDELQKNLTNVGLGGLKAENIDSEIKNLQNRFLSATQSGDKALAGDLSRQILQAELVLKRLGIPLGEVEGFAKSLRESITTPKERIEELNKQLNIASTKTKRDAILKDIEGIENSIIRKALTSFDDVMKSGQGLDQAFKAAQVQFDGTGLNVSNMQDFDQQVGRMFGSIANDLGADKTRKILDEQGFANMDQLQRMLLKGNESERKAATNAYEALSNALSTQQQIENNPILSITQKILKVNEDIRDAITGSFIFNLDEKWLLGILAASFGGTFGATVVGSSGILRLIQGLFSKLKGKAASSAIDILGAGASRGGKIAESVAANAGRLGIQEGIVKKASIFGKTIDYILNSLKALGKGLFNIVSGPFKFFGGLSQGTVLGGGLLGKGTSKLGLGAATGGVLTAVFAAIEGGMGAWNGYINTADTFNDALKNVDGTMKEATSGMKLSSTLGGGVAGVLDSLTFGLLSLVGLTKPLQKLISWISYTIINPIESFFGSLWKSFVSQLDTPTFKNLTDSFTRLINTVSNMFLPVWESVGPLFSDLGSVVGETLAEALNVVIPAITHMADGFSYLIDQTNNFFTTLKGYIDSLASYFGFGSNVESTEAAAKKAGEQMAVSTGAQSILVSDKLSAINDPALKKSEIEDYLNSTNVQIAGVKNNLAYGQKIGAPEFEVQNDLNRLSLLQNRKTFLESQLKELNKVNGDNVNSMKNQEDALNIVAKTMEMGQTKGSIYVHDIHCEAILNEIYKSLVKAGVVDTGAFSPEEVKDAMRYSDITSMSERLFGVSDDVNKKVGSNLVGLGAFDGSGPVKEAIGETINNNVYEKIVSSMINTGAFTSDSVKEAMEAKITDLVGKDLNHIIESNKSSNNSKITGSVSKSLYFDEDDREHYEKVSVNPSIFSPEDAADYVYQQLQGSKPSYAETTGLLDVIAEENKKHTELMTEMLEELKKFNFRSSELSKTIKGKVRGGSSQTSSSLNYKHAPIRGNWENLQAVVSSRQDNLDVRPR